jgi:hypothetical protein
MLDCVADLDLVASVQLVGPTGHWDAVVAKFSVLAANRLGASVELVEMLVGGLRDHDRGLAVGVVGVGGVERLVLGVSLVCVQVDAVAAVVAMDCLFDLALAK